MKTQIATLIIILALSTLTGCAEFFEASAPQHSRQPSRECAERHMSNLYDCLQAENNEELCYEQFQHSLVYQCDLSESQASRVVQICRDNPIE